MKNLIVIGGTSGIGKKIIEDLDGKYNIITISRSDSGASKHIKCDVLKSEIPKDELPDEIHGLVYTPGSINLKPFRSLKDQDFIDDFNISALGAAKVIQQLHKPLKKGNASIVLFSTVAVQQGMAFHASVAMSKGAVEGLTRSLAAEFAPIVRVNCIAPSLTDTPMAENLLSNESKQENAAQRHPLKRYGNVNDIASAAKYLLSDDASWVTGQILHVDGGMSSIKGL